MNLKKLRKRLNRKSLRRFNLKMRKLLLSIKKLNGHQLKNLMPLALLISVVRVQFAMVIPSLVHTVLTHLPLELVL